MEQVKNRDANILLFLAKNGFASPRSLEREFFKGIAHRNHYRSLARLKQKHLVEELLGDTGELLGYKLSAKGLRLTRKVIANKWPVQKPPEQFRTNYTHDELLVQLRSIFEKCPAIYEYKPEQIVREELATRYGFEEQEGSGYKVPDATFQMKTRKGYFRVALELELTRKSKRRYRKIIKQLARSKDWNQVFFIVRELSTAKVITDLLKELCEKDSDLKFEKTRSGFYFAKLDELLKSKETCTFSGEEKSFSLLELAKDSASNAQVQLTTESSVPLLGKKTKRQTN